MQKINMHPKFIDYYWNVKKFLKLSMRYEFGTGQVPSGYSEQLCREVYGMVKYDKTKHGGDFGKKSFDAYKNGEFIEIKFNVNKNNGMTIDLSKEFDKLYISTIDFNSDVYTVLIFDGIDVRKFNQSKNKINTCYNTFENNIKHIEEKYKFTQSGLYKFKHLHM